MVVTMASNAATRSTGGRSPGSIRRLNSTKKIAANRSRNGVSSASARSRTSPDSAMPTRNAPIAELTWTCSARPPTTRIPPITLRSSASSERAEITLLIGPPKRMAMINASVVTARATPTESVPDNSEPPTSSTPSTGR